MITDKTLDEALVELLRKKRALEALRKHRKAREGSAFYSYSSEFPVHAAAKRATLDLTRKLADLRAGR